ncbi:MAG TPA: TonB-dependent receptor [Candidatus Sulfotelmatobacter sp.]|nr:TonB-dependent receptor [Candidatus Sulfotelmatobacter sp.]
MSRFRLHLGILLFALPLLAQSNAGELRLKVTDPHGLGAKIPVELVSEANEYHNTFVTDENGTLIAKRLPFGMYRVQIQQAGFAEVSAPVEIRSAIPIEYSIKLTLASVTTSVTVQDVDTLIDPYRAGSTNEIGAQTIQTRTTSLPGRSLQDLVNSEPGWLYEGNAVLHPRGSEYETQFVVDGIPLTDNRSPSFGPEIEADDVDSLNVYTAGIPAEFGRKMGGVIEVNTLKDTQAGLHGQTVLSGGSFDTAGAFAQAQYVWKGNTLGGSASGSMTSHYLNPVVPQNYTNHGTTGDFSVNYERDLSVNDRLGLIVRHGLTRFQIPNEQVQQAAGQRQDGDSFETMGIVSYQHVFSSNALGSLRGMVRDHSSDLFSNPSSTPVIVFLKNNFKEGYFNGSLSAHHGRHEWKAGIESDVLFLHENFSDTITDPSRFPDGTPPTFAFAGSRPDIEQSAYVQDLIRLGNWTISAGLRWDHYQLLVNQNAISPRLSLARFFPSAGLVIHASYDRVFETPSSENILLSSSSQVVSLSPDVLRLPVKPSHGNYFEIGGTKSFFGQFRFDANYFRRCVNNYADDDQILSTAVSFPIAFDKAAIYGAEGKIEIPKWGRFSGFASYSYIVGNAWFPVTGGLFLADAAVDASTQLTGHFPDSQDQRNSVRLRLRYQLISRVWIAGSAEYGSGLPFEFTGTYEEALAQYGPAVVNRLNFDRGRVKPSLAIGASVGADIYKNDKVSMRIQGDVQNINNRLNVIDFGGLFSGNAIAPARSYSLRLQTAF